MKYAVIHELRNGEQDTTLLPLDLEEALLKVRFIAEQLGDELAWVQIEVTDGQG